MAGIYADLHQHIQDQFNEAGVEIMSPHYTQIREGNKTTTPDQYLPKHYQAPGLRIWPLSPLSPSSERFSPENIGLILFLAPSERLSAPPRYAQTGKVAVQQRTGAEACPVSDRPSRSSGAETESRSPGHRTSS